MTKPFTASGRWVKMRKPIAAAGEAVQQDDRRQAGITGFAVENLAAIDGGIVIAGLGH
ncbi:hypothetical protein [Sphingomonas sp. 28-62-11]|uniref:hypothetical protein n=1 Tax=Sphingomonas sp. 28-62-11 TaxID=1970432 RepID=UPI0035A9575C